MEHAGSSLPRTLLRCSLRRNLVVGHSHWRILTHPDLCSCLGQACWSKPTRRGRLADILGNITPHNTQLAQFGDVQSTGMGMHLSREAQQRGTADTAVLVLHQHELGSTPELVPEVLQPKLSTVRVAKGCMKGGIHGVLLRVYPPDGEQAAEVLSNSVAAPAALH